MFQSKSPTRFLRLKESKIDTRKRPVRRVAFLDCDAPQTARPRSIPKSTFDFDLITEVPCFVTGTLIQTSNGNIPVEQLRKGDALITRDNGVQKIRWVGNRDVEADDDTAPIQIAAGAMGNDMALTVSPEHRMLLTGYRCNQVSGSEEAIAQARHLVNGRDITRGEAGPVTYFHLACDRHEIIIANGAFTESFHPNSVDVGQVSVKTRKDLIAAFPVMGADAAAYGPKVRPEVASEEARLIRP